MCGGSSNYRTPSLFVGWLYVAYSVFFVIYYTYELVTFEQNPEENTESEQSVESDFRPIFDNGVKQKNILYIAASVLLCLVPSILLVKGIKQNRPKLIAPWLYIAYVSVVFYCIGLIFISWVSIAFTGSLGAGLSNWLPLSLALIFSILCIYPVRKLYKILSIPPPVLPTHCVMLTNKPEEDQHYMPVFNN